MKKQSLVFIIVSPIVILLIVAGIIFVWQNGASSDKTGNTNKKQSFFGLFDVNSPIIDGLFSESTSPSTTNTPNANGKTDATPLSPLRQLYPYPVSGMTIVTMSHKDANGTKTAIPGVRVMERSSGHIFDIPFNGTDAVRITGTTIPGVEQVFWNNNVSRIFTRRINDTTGTLQNIFLNVTHGTSDITGTAEDESQGSLLATSSMNNVLEGATSPDGKSIFLLLSSPSGSVGETTFIDESGEGKQIFSSPFKEWLPEWPRTDTIYLTTKPSSGIPGYTYSISPTKKNVFQKLIGGIPGLTTHMSPVKGLGLIGSASGTTFSLSLLTDGTMSALGFNTLPEKCAWMENGSHVYCGVPIAPIPATYPDDWYKGALSFTDAIWSEDIQTGEAMLMADTGAFNAPPLDIINPLVSTDGKYLIFINKYDLTPWVFELIQ